MKTMTISLADSDNETVDAEYFQIEDGWVTFKTVDHKAVASYPEKRVTRIKSEDKGPTVKFEVSGLPPEEEMRRAGVVEAMKVARWAGRS